MSYRFNISASSFNIRANQTHTDFEAERTEAEPMEHTLFPYTIAGKLSVAYHLELFKKKKGKKEERRKTREEY